MKITSLLINVQKKLTISRWCFRSFFKSLLPWEIRFIKALLQSCANYIFPFKRTQMNFLFPELRTFYFLWCRQVIWKKQIFLSLSNFVVLKWTSSKDIHRHVRSQSPVGKMQFMQFVWLQKAHSTNIVCMVTMTRRNQKAIPKIIACLPVSLKYDKGPFTKATRCENSSHLK